MPALDELFVRIGADVSPLRRAGRQVAQALAPVKAQLSNIGGALTVGLSAPLALVGKRAFDAAVEFDNLKRGLVAVAGSTQEAENQLARLREVAKLPGLGFNQAVQGSVNLQAAGLSAEIAERSLAAFGNALATVGRGAADLDGVSLALTQIIAKGKVTAEEINQIAERVPQVRRAMQAAFGTAQSEDIQKLGITANQFIAGLVSELEKLPRAASGIGNELENAQQAVNEALQAIGAAIIPIVSEILQKVVPAVQRLAAAFQSLPAGVQRNIVIFAGLAAALGPVALAISALISPVGLVVAGVAALGAAAFAVIKNWETVGPFFGRLFRNIGTIIRNSVDLYINYIRLLVLSAVNIFTEGIAGILGSFAGQARLLGFDDLASNVDSFREKISGIVTREDLGEVINNFKELGGGIGAALDDIAVQAVQTGADIAIGLGNVIDNVREAVQGGGSFGVAAPEIVEPTPEREQLQTATGLGIQGPELTDPFSIVNQSLEDLNFNVALSQANIAGLFEGLVNFEGIAVGAVDSVSNGFGQAVANISIFKDGFSSLGDAAKSFGETMRNIFRQVIAQIAAAIARALVLRAILSVTGLGAARSGGGFLGGVLRGVLGRQFGGQVRAGQSVVVGENGLELFTPSVGGFVTPFNKIPTGGGVGSAGAITPVQPIINMSISDIPLGVAMVDIGLDSLSFAIGRAEDIGKTRRGF